MKTSCEFHFGFWDVTARGDAVLETTQNQVWADIGELNKKEPVALPDVATLEPSFGWPLDGTKVLMPDDPAALPWGWWSAGLSGADGEFAAAHVLSVNFFGDDGLAPTAHSSAGITLCFAATPPRLINIRWYGADGGLLADRDFTPDALNFFCDCPVDDYAALTVTIPGLAAPERFLRCERIIFGALEVIAAERLQKASVTEEIQPVSLTLPISVLELSFFTADGRFNLLSPEGVYRFFQWRQPMDAYASVNGELRFMGRYYLQEAAGHETGLADLKLVSCIGILDTLDFDGGIYEQKPVSALLEDILGPEEFPFELDGAFASERISGYLPICTKREALQQLAFAIGAAVDSTRGEAIRIYPAPEGVSGVIGADRKIIGHSVTLEEPVTRVELLSHSYSLNVVEEKQLARLRLEAGRRRITHSAPSQATDVSGSAEILEAHPNYTLLNVLADGVITLTGRNYTDSATAHTVQAEALPAGAKSSVKTINGATLTDISRGDAAARRVFDYYGRRYKAEGRLLPGNEALGQLIELQSIGARSLEGTIERLHIDLAGGYLARVSIRGNCQ